MIDIHPKAVLFDMDGILYDSMPWHAEAWERMCREAGIDARYEEFFAYEGRTGAATISLLMQRQFGRAASEEEARRLYAIKSKYFAAKGPAPIMPGAQQAVQAALDLGAKAVLVTGSGQASLLERLQRDFPGAFGEGLRVTAHDVRHGKPDPEPYLAGLAKAGVRPDQALAVDNAPLGVESASRAGVYTIGVRTGPLEPGALLEAGADIEIDGMERLAQLLRKLNPAAR